MAISHLGLSLISIIFLAGSLVLLWFIILSGITPTTPLSSTYFLRADTSGITGARDISQWTYFRICGASNLDCGPSAPALAFGAAWTGPDTQNAPPSLAGPHGGGTTSTTYWYLWRFGTVMYLITLFFETIAFFTSFLACCGRLGSAVTGLLAGVALFFGSVAVALMTATFVKARNAFVADGRDASLGSWAFGFAWGSWAALLIATVLFCVGRGRSSKTGAGAVTSGRKRRWGRRRASTRSYDGRRVKEEYP
ncbi:SUR7/PalI family-domain-containing protein [Schizothecium vesticola]|uniref:SUR7/PalI family-domain-containing protein n=1 Tax=Schizothecium vesticola TaxID=314040 RepID=A0AA40F135_9PEZI|nr:SUR7/PalI family-domain-containing protein [Schizothecium vesticola]